MRQKGWAMDQKMLNALKQVADGIAAQFGNNCEVAIYDPSEDNGYSVVSTEDGEDYKLTITKK